MKHQATISRLRRIEGQVRGIARMVEEEQYCIDIVNQIAAVRNALDRVTLMILKNHMSSCLTTAIRSEDSAEAQIDEVLTAVERYIK